MDDMREFAELNGLERLDHDLRMTIRGWTEELTKLERKDVIEDRAITSDA